MEEKTKFQTELYLSNLLKSFDFFNRDYDADEVDFVPNQKYDWIASTHCHMNVLYKFDKEKLISEFDKYLNNPEFNPDEICIPDLLRLVKSPLVTSIGIDLIKITRTNECLIYSIDFISNTYRNYGHSNVFMFIVRCKNQEDVDKRVKPLIQMFENCTTHIDKEELLKLSNYLNNKIELT